MTRDREYCAHCVTLQQVHWNTILKIKTKPDKTTQTACEAHTRTHIHMWYCQNVMETHDREERSNFCADEWTSDISGDAAQSQHSWDEQIPAKLPGSSPRLGGCRDQGKPTQRLPKPNIGQHQWPGRSCSSRKTQPAFLVCQHPLP